MEEKELELEETAEEGSPEERKKEEAKEGEPEGSEMTGKAEEDAEAPSVPLYAGSGKRVRISGPMLYENSFTITPEIYQEFLKAFMGRYRKLYYLMGGVSLILGIFSWRGGAGPSALLFFVITALCIVLPVKTYRSSKKKKYAQMMEKNGGKPLERRVAFYMSGFEIYSNNGAHSVFRYGDVTKIISSRSLYVLVVQKKLSLLVLKDSFTRGTLEEWKTFMNKKGLWKVK